LFSDRSNFSFQRTGILAKRDDTTLRLLIWGKHAGAGFIFQKKAVAGVYGFLPGAGDNFLQTCRIQRQDIYEVQERDDVVDVNVFAADAAAVLVAVLKEGFSVFQKAVLGCLKAVADLRQQAQIMVGQTVYDVVCFENSVAGTHIPRRPDRAAVE
jgi:hypothetical protein